MKKWNEMTSREKISGIVALAIFIPILTIILLVIFSGSPKKETPPTSLQPTSSVQTTPAPEKTWHAVKTLSGIGMKTSEQFIIKGKQWRVNWSNQGNGNFIISTNKINGYASCSVLANMIGTGKDTSYCYDSGDFYLDIIGDKWNIDIEDFY